MRISRIELKNFKRFTDLIISDIPETSKLVLLIGSNGSGKSSLFDAFDWLGKGQYKELPYRADETTNYYKKNHDSEISVLVQFTDGKLIEKKGKNVAQGAELIQSFLGRSSIRIVPHLIGLGQSGYSGSTEYGRSGYSGSSGFSISGLPSNANPADIISKDLDSPITYIENDTRFINDVYLYIQQINNALREPIFSGRKADTLKIFKDFIEPLNNSLLKIFGGDSITTIQIAEFQDPTPHTTAKLIFKKGESKINYDLLSHGEKQVIILLINFIVRQEFYKDSVVFIDEMDCHLNTSLQSNLLEEIVLRWIPESAQLWTASHALGFIDYAKNSEIASTIDFDLFNFDIKKELIPLSKNKLDVYEIAIPKSMISSILKGYKLVVVENKDDEYYNTALGQEGYLFLPANNNREVFLTVKSDKGKLGLRDRDYLKTDEIEKIKAEVSNLKILALSTFENYIYHPNNIAELNIRGFNRDEYVAEITKQKNDKIFYIVGEIGTSRNHYVEFKDCIKNDGNILPIIEALKSDNFDEFYPYFNMKNHFDKGYLNQYKYSFLDLSKTEWFKNQVLQVLSSYI